MICQRCKFEETIYRSSKCRNCFLADRREKERLSYNERRYVFIESLGGKCVDCSSTKRLEFDHICAKTKSFEIRSRLATGSMVLLTEEIAKCVLRCRPCHVLKTSREGEWTK